MEIRNSITEREERLYKIQSLIGHFSLNKRGVELTELLMNAGIEVNAIPFLKPDALLKKVSGVCRPGSRFTKGCIACQLYEDGPGVMRWAYQNGAVLLVTKEQVDDLPCG